MIARGARRSHFVGGDRARHDLGEDVRLAHATSNQLGVLRPEVDDENGVVQCPMPTPWERCICFPSVCKRGRQHDLGLLELLEGLVAARRHRRAQRAEEVEASVVLVRRSEQDLLQGAAHLRAHARAARQGRVEGRHAPVKAARRRFDGAGERRADHDGVGATGDRPWRCRRPCSCRRRR